jgi:hypothetical protein
MVSIIEQYASQLVPHTPPPEGPAAAQFWSALEIAASAWLKRQPSVLIDISVAVPGAKATQLFMQLKSDLY